MKLAALKGGIQPLEVRFPGGEEGEDEVLNIQYRPGELTMEAADEMYASIDAGRGDRVAGLLLQKILVSWDLEEDILDDQGNPTGEAVPVPCSMEGLKKIPLPAIGVILSAMTDAVRPNPPTGETSNGGSPQTVKSESPQAGTTSSEPQNITEFPLGNS